MKMVKLFLFWRFGLFFLTYLGSLTFPLLANGGIGAIGPGKSFDFLASWAQWDGGHYYHIAQYGYFAPNEFAFFPLLPILIKLVSVPLLNNYLLAGLVVTNLCFLGFLIVFNKLVKNSFGKIVAFAATISYLLFPTSYLAVAIYSESLFLLLSALSIYSLEKKRFFQASIFAGLASATRVAGIFLVIPIAWYIYKNVKDNFKKNFYRLFYIPLSVLGFLAYSAYLYIRFRDPFYFSTVQLTWHRKFVNPYDTIYNYLTNNPPGKPINDYLDVYLTLLFLTILIIGIKKLPLTWIIFGILVILLPASTATLTSMPRYILASFPVFILIGMYLADKRYLRLVVWGSFLFLQIILATMFVNGYWTA